MASSLLHPLLSLTIAAPASSPRPSNPSLSSASSSRLSVSGFRLIPVSSNNGRRLQLPMANSSSGEDAGTAELEAAEEEEGETLTEEAQEDALAEGKPSRKPRVKLGDIMGILNKRAIEEVEKERTVPDIRVGDIVEIKLEVPENRRRASTYKGIVMSKQNAGIHTTIRIRRIIAGVGVEIVFPVYSPNIKEIKVVAHRKVRRARLYYLRDKLPRLSTFK